MPSQHLSDGVAILDEKACVLSLNPAGCKLLDVAVHEAKGRHINALTNPTDDFVAISTAFKRIKNILRQARESGKKWPENFSSDRLPEPAEQALAAQVNNAGSQVEALRREKRYEEALTQIAHLRPVTDTFFDKVMVMVDDEQVRANRLALLRDLLSEFSTIADFSEIVTAGK